MGSRSDSGGSLLCSRTDSGTEQKTALPASRLDDRGLSPVVGKLFEVGLVLLYVALLSTTLYGGVVPDYRESAGTELAERTLAGAAQRIEAAVPGAAGPTDVRAGVDLPSTIAGSNYAVRTRGRTLLLDHPNGDIEARTRVILPDRVQKLRGSWESGTDAVVRVTGDDDGLVVELTEGKR